MNDNTNIEYFSKGEKMSILSRYYHKRYSRSAGLSPNQPWRYGEGLSLCQKV